MQTEVKVGAFFLAAILLIGLIVFFLGDYASRWASHTITAHFDDVAGLETGAEVRMSGVRIGRVLDVSLQPYQHFADKPAAVVMAINRDVILYEGDKFYVDQAGIIGEKYMSLIRTTRKDKVRLADGSHVEGGGLAGLSGLSQDAKDLMSRAGQTLERIEDTLAGPGRKEQFDQIVNNVISLTARADSVSLEALRFAKTLNSMSRASAPSVTEMAKNLAAASKTVNDTTRLVQRMLAQSPVPANAAKASSNIADSTADIKRITENLAQTLADPKLNDEMRKALENMQTATENLATLTGDAKALLSDDEGVGQDVRAAIANLQKVAADLAETSAHVREVVTDPQMTSDVRTTVTKTRETMENAADLTQRAGHTMDKVDQTMNSVSDTIHSVKPLHTRAQVRFEAATERGMRADFDADLYYGARKYDFWRIGIRDAGDRETLNLQRSIPLTEISAFRAGIFGNKAGVGYDRSLSNQLSLEADFWDASEYILDLKTHYRLHPNFDLTLGANDLLDNADAFIGFRYFFDDAPKSDDE